MRYYIAYKFSWVEQDKLKQNLNIISKAILETWNESFIFFRDIQKRWDVTIPNEEIMKIDFEEIDNSDWIFVFVDNKEKSEWMLLECGYAKAKWKKIILAIKKWIDLRLLRSLADKVIEFDNVEDLEEKINLT